MTACELLELGLNKIHEAACALYIRHKYNKAIVTEAFDTDEYFGANMIVVFQERIETAMKTVHKLSAATEVAVGFAGGPFSGKGPKKSRGGKGYGARQHSHQGGGIFPGFGGIEQ
jgi:hypothetical protein